MATVTLIPTAQLREGDTLLADASMVSVDSVTPDVMDDAVRWLAATCISGDFDQWDGPVRVRCDATWRVLNADARIPYASGDMTGGGCAMNRSDALLRLADAYGRATECEIPAKPGRWALMESDEGSADNGGPWWTTGDDWRELLSDSAAQEDPASWPATWLVDLDSITGEPGSAFDGWSTEVERAFVYEPTRRPR